ncbi:MAG: hypothetical protein ABI823_10685 [Bryobacteraceae bacterium]
MAVDLAAADFVEAAFAAVDLAAAGFGAAGLGFSCGVAVRAHANANVVHKTKVFMMERL